MLEKRTRNLGALRALAAKKASIFRNNTWQGDHPNLKSRQTSDVADARPARRISYPPNGLVEFAASSSALCP